MDCGLPLSGKSANDPIPTRSSYNNNNCSQVPSIIPFLSLVSQPASRASWHESRNFGHHALPITTP